MSKEYNSEYDRELAAMLLPSATQSEALRRLDAAYPLPPNRNLVFQRMVNSGKRLPYSAVLGGTVLLNQFNQQKPDSDNPTKLIPVCGLVIGLMALGAYAYSREHRENFRSSLVGKSEEEVVGMVSSKIYGLSSDQAIEIAAQMMSTKENPITPIDVRHMIYSNQKVRRGKTSFYHGGQILTDRYYISPENKKEITDHFIQEYLGRMPEDRLKMHLTGAVLQSLKKEGDKKK